jgi:branched-chain amino acid aminotransferase
VFDHGLLYGDSVYETFKTHGGRLFLFSRHFARLEQSARGVCLELPWSKERTRDEILRTIAAAKYPVETRIRLVVTRGVGDLVPDPETCRDPQIIIMVSPLKPMPAELYTKGVDVIVSTIPRGGMVAQQKTGNLMHQVLATREANAKAAYEAILLNTDGYMSDGITSNIYMIHGSTLKTPSVEASIIEGITRGAVLDLARNSGMTVVEGLFRPAEFRNAEEMFLTSTNREVVPIVRVDGKPIGNGRPGPWTLKILDAYRKAIEQLARED